jgi:hypothetical protein
VRQRKEETVDAVERLRLFDKAQLGQAVEVAVHFTDRLPCMFVRGYENHVDVRMEEQNTEQLRAAVS